MASVTPDLRLPSSLRRYQIYTSWWQLTAQDINPIVYVPEFAQPNFTHRPGFEPRLVHLSGRRYAKQTEDSLLNRTEGLHGVWAGGNTVVSAVQDCVHAIQESHGLGLKSLKSRENGRDCVQESYRVGSFIWWHNFGKYSMSTEKTDVQNLTDKQIKTVSFEANAGQSTVWQHFTSTSCDWIATLHRSWNADDAVLKFKPRDGTKGLQTHLDYCDTVCLG